MKKYYTYITSNPGKTVLYTGMTNNLTRRLNEHFNNRGNKETFAGRYRCYHLVYFEEYSTPMDSINREKEIKQMSREEKEELIKSLNPDFTPLNYLFAED